VIHLSLGTKEGISCKSEELLSCWENMQ